MGFLDDVLNKAVPQGSGIAKPLMLAFVALQASGALTRKQAAGREPGVRRGGWRIVGRIGWTARNAAAERSWRRSEIMGGQRAKSADLAWLTRFSARSVDC